MSRFLSTYSSDFIPPECAEDDAPEVSLPQKRCVQCPDPCSSKRHSCASSNSCVRSIQQIDYTIVPQIRNCHCTCQCCLSKKPERTKELCQPAPVPSCPPPTPRPVTCPNPCCTRAPSADPCCQLHKIRMAHAIEQDPECFKTVCCCKPKACLVCRTPKEDCNCCRVRNEDPQIRHSKSHTSFLEKVRRGGCQDESGSCSRNPSKLRFDVEFSSKQNSS
ncbi:keratin-associated protein 4-4-like [Topomyia yanbarensis]|uniref:keratin-associated protein 4-4-like n=1 Tax=Topomyia yanbarensis TaxID=2498891 RepID=UPI00273BBFDA|nr:keratin-associated protein 4-4-like [Topomyia yanbarensis]